MIPWLDSNRNFPPLELALREPNGLLCAGGDLTPQRIVSAYLSGVFPWYLSGEPILWWSPDPRMVLFPSEFRVSRSLRKVLRRADYQIRLDSHFESVIRSCAEMPRKGLPGTWITPEIQFAYGRLYELGYVHCVETWKDDELVGGLYGMAIGKMFYGESMFSRTTDASKIAMAHLVRFLVDNGFGMIDCQMNTSHLASLGAREISRDEFVDRLRDLVVIPPLCGRWSVDAAQCPWN